MRQRTTPRLQREANGGSNSRSDSEANLDLLRPLSELARREKACSSGNEPSLRSSGREYTRPRSAGAKTLGSVVWMTEAERQRPVSGGREKNERSTAYDLDGSSSKVERYSRPPPLPSRAHHSSSSVAMPYRKPKIDVPPGRFDSERSLIRSRESAYSESRRSGLGRLILTPLVFDNSRL